MLETLIMLLLNAVLTHHHEDIDYKDNNKLIVAILLHNFP